MVNFGYVARKELTIQITRQRKMALIVEAEAVYATSSPGFWVCSRAFRPQKWLNSTTAAARHVKL